MQDYLDLDRN